MEPWPNREQIAIELSQEQWVCLIELIKTRNEDSIDSSKHTLDEAISNYLWKTFVYQQALMPADKSNFFNEVAKLSNDLMSILDDHFFPFNPENCEFGYNEIRRRRVFRSKSPHEKPLFREKLGEKGVAIGGSYVERNEFIRRELVNHINRISTTYLSLEPDMEFIRAALCELNILAQTVVEKTRSAKGKRRDPYLAELMARALSVYGVAGGRGFAGEDALPFMELFMEYVRRFALDKIGQKHARGLLHGTTGEQLKQKIKATRKKTFLWD